MAKQVTQSELLATMKRKGLGATFQTAKDVPANVGNARLPAGIEAGTAQLRSCKIGVYEQGDYKGELFFMAVGVVVEPKTHEGTTILGMRTQLGPEPLCDTPKSNNPNLKTKQDHVNRVVGWLYGLGVKAGSINSEEAFFAASAALEKNKPHFKFRTWKGAKQEIRKMEDGKYWLVRVNDDGSVTTVQGKGPYKDEAIAKQLNQFAGRDPRTVEEWNGVCPPPESKLTQEEVALQNFSQNGSTTHAAANEGADPNPEGIGEDSTFNSEGAADGGSEGSNEESGLSQEEAFLEEVKANIDTLVEQANQEQELAASGQTDDNWQPEAQQKLTEAAQLAGVDQAIIDSADTTWQDLANAILGDTASTEPEPKGWDKDDVCFYKQLDKDGKSIKDAKGKEKKASQHIIVTVNKEKKTVTLKDVATQKTIMHGRAAKQVSWDDIKAEAF